VLILPPLFGVGYENLLRDPPFFLLLEADRTGGEEISFFPLFSSGWSTFPFFPSLRTSDRVESFSFFRAQRRRFYPLLSPLFCALFRYRGFSLSVERGRRRLRLSFFFLAVEAEKKVSVTPPLPRKNRRHSRFPFFAARA